MSDYFSNQDLSGLLSFEGEDWLDLFGNGAGDQLDQLSESPDSLLQVKSNWPLGNVHAQLHDLESTTCPAAREWSESIYPCDPKDAVAYPMSTHIDGAGMLWVGQQLPVDLTGLLPNDGHFPGSTTNYYSGIPGQEPECESFCHQTVLGAGFDSSGFIGSGVSALSGTRITEIPQTAPGHHHMLCPEDKGSHEPGIRRKRILFPKTNAIENSFSATFNPDAFTFESGCRPAPEYSSVSKVQKQSRKVTAFKTGLFCTFAGCQEKREFRRKYELERHMRKHNPREAYSCPVLECGRHCRQPFYREDKLKAHMERMHSDDEPSACPKAYCQAGVLPFDLLRVHVQSHIIPEGNVFTNFLPRSCPVAGSKVRPRLEVRNIPGPKGHLMRYHDPAERAKQHAVITEAGFGSSSGEIICPICRQKSNDRDSFARHLENRHLGQHAATFARVLRFSISKTTHDTSDEIERQSLQNWRVWHDIPDAISGQCFQCPGYMLYFGTSDDEIPWTRVSDHPGLFVVTEELRRHRRGILRLLLSFNSHPVFDDVRRPT